MKNCLVIIIYFLSLPVFAQNSKYYGWWEHKGKIYSIDSQTVWAVRDLCKEFNLEYEKVTPLSETEIQFYPDSFIIKYGISVSTGAGENREFKWFSSLSGIWKIENNSSFKNQGKRFTIRENNFTVNEDSWKDSIVNRTILFKAENSDLITLKFNTGSKAYGVFNNQKDYPYTWFYLEYGFGNIYTKYY